MESMIWWRPCEHEGEDGEREQEGGGEDGDDDDEIGRPDARPLAEAIGA